jgi:hypothetical protein
MKAWLVTWEWLSNEATVADHIAAILNSRWSIQRVAQTVEFLYIKGTACASDMAAYARRSTSQPYRVEGDFNGRMTCGHNPWLFARLVSNLKVSIDPETRLETIAWIEPRVSKPSNHGFPQVARKAFPAQSTRQLTGPLSDELIWDRSAGSLKAGWKLTPMASQVLTGSLPESKRHATTKKTTG